LYTVYNALLGVIFWFFFYLRLVYLPLELVPITFECSSLNVVYRVVSSTGEGSISPSSFARCMEHLVQSNEHFCFSPVICINRVLHA